jgi:hypothetical protein
MSPILTGIALGVAGAFVFDPQQGRRRRALLRDKMVHSVRQGRDFADAASQDLRARAQGAAARMRTLRGEPITDGVLVSRVRAKLGRYVSHRRAIHVTAQGGVVTLTGDVIASEHNGLVRALRLVPGVQDLDDRLDVHPSAEGVSSLQGGTPPSGERLELLQARWAPGTRAVVGGAGALLILYALARGGVRGVGQSPATGIGAQEFGDAARTRAPRKRGAAGGLERRVVDRQAERHAAVGGRGDVGVEGEVLLYGMRVAEGARHRTRLVEPARTRQAEHHVDRA